MALPGFFIEYLINGSVSLIWIWLVIRLLGQQIPDEPPSVVILFAPVLYVLGMIIDFIAKFVTNLLSGLLKNKAEREKGYFQKQFKKSFWRDKPRGLSDSDSAIISAYSKELASDVAMRSSRDRVARGSFINVLIITIFFTVYCYTRTVPHIPYYAALVCGLLLTCLCFSMWRHFDALTTRYKDSSLAALANKEKGQSFQ